MNRTITLKLLAIRVSQSVRILLTDAQVWAILNAPGLTDAQLATALGVKESTIHNWRWLLARHGWTCGVRYAPCRHCGELAALRGSYAIPTIGNASQRRGRSRRSASMMLVR